MEKDIIEKRIVNLGSFAGSGSGSGSGYGSGSGSGFGFGDGDGSGSGYQIKKHTKRDVHYIDSIPTIIVSIFGNGEINETEFQSMTAGNGGKLNPTWVEWLMGFPLGWSDLDVSEMQ